MAEGGQKAFSVVSMFGWAQMPPGLSDTSGQLQNRVALYARVIALILGVMWFARTMVSLHLELFGRGGQVIVGWLLHAAGVLTMLTLWRFCAGLPRALGTLHRVEAGGTIMLGVALGVATMGIPGPIRPGLLATFGVFVALALRAALVPSSAARTTRVGALAMLGPVLASAYLTWSEPPLPGLPPGVRWAMPLAWALSTLAVTGVTSKVIYQLSAEIREAAQVGRYRLERKLGAGGMGVVYLASHAMLRRPTAVKLLPAETAGEQAVERFEREVQETSRLAHPNTVSIYDYGRTPEGIFYYAMEFLDGVNLQQLVERDGAQPPGRVVHLLQQAAASLAEAHEAGLVHRDIKPANLMVCHRGGVPDVLKVLDFGLVKEAPQSEAQAPEDLGLTRPDAIVGTPHYLAPEAIAGGTLQGAPSDLYGLGCVAYYLLTGERVFDGESVALLCAMHVTAEPVPPSERMDASLSDELEALVLALLDKQPEARPSTGAELREWLDRCPDPWTREQGEAWWAEHAERAASDDSAASSPESNVPDVTIDFRARRVRASSSGTSD